eukprot:1159892-Pelagomonas_calceolata.AAC.31
MRKEQNWKIRTSYAAAAAAAATAAASRAHGKQVAREFAWRDSIKSSKKCKFSERSKDLLGVQHTCNTHHTHKKSPHLNAASMPHNAHFRLPTSIIVCAGARSLAAAAKGGTCSRPFFCCCCGCCCLPALPPLPLPPQFLGALAPCPLPPGAASPSPSRVFPTLAALLRSSYAAAAAAATPSPLPCPTPPLRFTFAPLPRSLPGPPASPSASLANLTRTGPGGGAAPAVPAVPAASGAAIASVKRCGAVCFAGLQLPPLPPPLLSVVKLGRLLPLVVAAEAGSSSWRTLPAVPLPPDAFRCRAEAGPCCWLPAWLGGMLLAAANLTAALSLLVASMPSRHPQGAWGASAGP